MKYRFKSTASKVRNDAAFSKGYSKAKRALDALISRILKAAESDREYAAKTLESNRGSASPALTRHGHGSGARADACAGNVPDNMHESNNTKESLFDIALRLPATSYATRHPDLRQATGSPDRRTVTDTAHSQLIERRGSP